MELFLQEKKRKRQFRFAEDWYPSLGKADPEGLGLALNKPIDLTGSLFFLSNSCSVESH